MNTPEFQDWLRRNDPESIHLTSPAVYDGEERRKNNTLQQALTASMDLEFEQLKANEQWAMRQAQLWRQEAKAERDRREWVENRMLIYGGLMLAFGVWALTVTFMLIGRMR